MAHCTKIWNHRGCHQTVKRTIQRYAEHRAGVANTLLRQRPLYRIHGAKRRYSLAAGAPLPYHRRRHKKTKRNYQRSVKHWPKIAHSCITIRSSLPNRPTNRVGERPTRRAGCPSAFAGLLPLGVHAHKTSGTLFLCAAWLPAFHLFSLLLLLPER